MPDHPPQWSDVEFYLVKCKGAKIMVTSVAASFSKIEPTILLMRSLYHL